MTWGPTTVPKPTLVKRRPPGIPAVPLNLLADHRQMALWRVAVGNKEAWAGTPARSRGRQRSPEGRMGRPYHSLVGSGDGWGSDCGARAIMGPWALLSGGHQAEGSLDIFAAEGGRKWMLLVSQEERGLGGHGIQVYPNPIPSLSLL